jgi:hypothetical protein
VNFFGQRWHSVTPAFLEAYAKHDKIRLSDGTSSTGVQRLYRQGDAHIERLRQEFEELSTLNPAT